MPRGQAMFLKSFVHWSSMGARDKSLWSHQRLRHQHHYELLPSVQSALCKPPPVLCHIGAARLSLGDSPKQALQQGLCSAPHINHSGCDCYCHSCRHLKTEDVVSSLLCKAFLPSPTACKGKHPFFCACACVCVCVFVLQQRNIDSDLKSRKKSCTAVLTEAVAGSLLRWCLSRVRALKYMHGSNLLCKSPL